MVWLNDVNVQFPEAPWGGIKDSGSGVELGRWGIEKFSRLKHVCTDSSSGKRRALWFPYECEAHSPERLLVSDRTLLPGVGHGQRKPPAHRLRRGSW